MDPWVLTATEPHAGRLYLANGYMSTALDWSGGMLFDSESVPCYLRGLYNDSGPEGVDRLARLPCWSRLRYGAPAVLREYRRDLDLARGTLSTSCLLEEERGTVRLEQTILVSRADPHQAAIRMSICPDFEGEIVVYADLEDLPGGDLVTLDVGANRASIWYHGRTRKYGVEVAETLSFQGEDRWTIDSRVGQNEVASALHTDATAGEEINLVQLVRVATGLETDDPVALTRRHRRSFDVIRADHERDWQRLWETDVQIEGDPEVQEFVRAGLFYLWSSLREGDEWSIAPMGLSSNGYLGHIFWDAELWMYPPLLVTHPEMARACLAYRERTLPAARDRAASNGHRGAQFPWEGAFTGEEMTPSWAETRDFQLHITADVALAHWWYFLNTGDLDWLRHHGFPVIRECAEFWSSRVEYNAGQDRYEISDVVCADEYAAHVDNDAFTNAAVREALRVARRAAELLREPVPAEWTTIADKIYVPYDPAERRHLEFDGYDGRVTKQADVELLAYPLEYVTDQEQIARDLDYYGQVIDPNGPAMSFSVYAIVSAQLGRAAQAYDYLKRSYVPNTRPPFQAFSETPTNNEFLFCTGVGGALQAVLFGFTGLRLREGYVVLDPLLPETWQSLRLRNLYLLGARTDIEILPGRLTLRRHLQSTTVSIDLFESSGGLSLRLDGVDEVRLMLGQEAAPRTLQAGEDIPIPSDAGHGLRLQAGLVDHVPALDVLLPHPARLFPSLSAAQSMGGATSS